MTKQQLIPLPIFLLLAVLIWVFPNWIQEVSQQRPATTYLSDSIDVITPSGTHSLTVEIAATPKAQTQGMMHRQEWRDMDGMLFVFEREQSRAFWMKDTPLPLDIIFFDSQGQVTNIIQNATPNDTTLLPSVEPALYVLEIPAGDTQRLRLDGTATLVTSSVMEQR